MNNIKKNQWQTIPFTNVKIDDPFWNRRLRVHNEVTLRACLEQCEKTGRLANFAKAAGRQKGDIEGMYFNDSDVYKVIEGVAYSFMSHPDADLESEMDQLIDDIVAAQESDGYLCTYFSKKEPEKKWMDMGNHEMYCGGHLIEAALAYYYSTGKRKLLDAAFKLVDHYEAMFGPEKRHWVAGHEEIELALIKLFQETGQERYWKLAYWLLEERGRGLGKGEQWEKEGWGNPYCQDDVPVREIVKVKGHAVRAMYLYSAMADIVGITDDQGYKNALDRVWENLIQRNLYITGGVGDSKHNEGFTDDYHLPNDTAYCETCASIGMVYWNHRMNLLHGEAKYADIIEKEIYNGILSGISLDGDRFFNVNPLELNGKRHRKEWYNVACCPTNLARFIPSIGTYIYAVRDREVMVNQYIQGSTTFELHGAEISLIQQSNYIREGKAELKIESNASATPFRLMMRYPGWCHSARVFINGLEQQGLQVEKGYIVFDQIWSNGDIVTIQFDMPVEKVQAHPLVKSNSGRVALQRGPVVYCIENADNRHLELDELVITEHSSLFIENDPNIMGGILAITGRGKDGNSFTAIPYHLWNNREPGFMQVWIRHERNERLYSI
jgi:DUF1680 family protein